MNFPYYQGSLDGYCGIYSIINAINLLIKDIDSAELFAKIIKTIGRRLSRMTLNGITDDELKEFVLAPTIGYLLTKNIELNYTNVEANNLDDFWKIVQNHYEEKGSGSIIMGMMGVREHWTCVKKITKKTIEFCDSGALKKFYREFVTIGEATKKRKHVFLPSETFLLYIKQLDK